MFLKSLQNFSGKYFAKFRGKHISSLQLYFKRDSSTDFFLQILWNFLKHLQVATFEIAYNNYSLLTVQHLLMIASTISILFLHQMYCAKKLILSEAASEKCFTKQQFCTSGQKP